MPGRVAIVPCPTYEEDRVRIALQEALQLLKWDAGQLTPGEQIYLKPNLAGALPPEKAVTTHPAVVKAVACWLKEQGAEVVIGDSPAGPASTAYLKLLYRRTGMEAVAEELGLSLDQDPGSIEVKGTDPRAMRVFTLSRAMAKSHGLINLPKFKTHLFTRMTGAVKNLYGAVSGIMKVAYHTRFKDPLDFSAMLLDLADILRPRLTVVDAVVGMEGDGPTWGRPRQVGYLIAGVNLIAIDAVLSLMMGFSLREVPLFRSAPPLEVQVVGVPLAEARVWGFQPPRDNSMPDGLEGLTWLPQRLKDRLGRELLPRPQINPEQCAACGRCEASCPHQAISLGQERARVDLDRCQRCWCCNEVCPFGAVDLAYSWLGNLANRRLRK
jgi:uncharacterized protein (DUF362 family)/Pyruvate/2-oxoacid:ferredoxin oxidoreductase delta subunit